MLYLPACPATAVRRATLGQAVASSVVIGLAGSFKEAKPEEELAYCEGTARPSAPPDGGKQRCSNRTSALSILFPWATDSTL